MQTQIGDIGYRRADGSVYRWEPILRETPDPAEAEADVAAKAARIFAAKFAAYKNAAAEKKTAP